jgi:hypothetical protein
MSEEAGVFATEMDEKAELRRQTERVRKAKVGMSLKARSPQSSFATVLTFALCVFTFEYLSSPKRDISRNHARGPIRFSDAPEVSGFKSDGNCGSGGSTGISGS